MTIDDLYATCYPAHVTEPQRVTVDVPKKAEEVKPEQTAENAGEVAEKAIENIQPDAGEQPAETLDNNSVNKTSAETLDNKSVNKTSAEGTEGVNK